MAKIIPEHFATDSLCIVLLLVAMPLLLGRPIRSKPSQQFHKVVQRARSHTHSLTLVPLFRIEFYELGQAKILNGNTFVWMRAFFIIHRRNVIVKVFTAFFVLLRASPLV